MKKLIFIILTILYSIAAFANIGIYKTPSSPVSDLTIVANNSLKVIKEKIFFNIKGKDLKNHITIRYKIKNVSDEEFKSEFIFLASTLKENNFKIKVDDEPHEFTTEHGKEIITNLKKINRNYTRFKKNITARKFELTFAPDETKDILITVEQAYSFDRSKGGDTYASSSHFLNISKPIGFLMGFHYFLYPLKSFAKGIDSLEVTIKHPKYWNKLTLDKANINIPLQFIEKTDHMIYKGTFNKLPANVIDIKINTHAYNHIGFTITPFYFFNFTEEKNDFAFSFSFDYVFKYNQMSIGGMLTLNGEWFLYEELKLFPASHVYGYGGCFDFRFGLGVVQKISPQLELGLRVSAGLRVMLPFEVSYQVLTPLVNRSNWNHSLFLSVPLAF